MFVAEYESVIKPEQKKSNQRGNERKWTDAIGKSVRQRATKGNSIYIR